TALALTLAVIALFATCMALCWKPVAAVQFALFMATQNAGYVIGAALTGPALESLTDTQALLVAGAFPVAAALLLLRVDLAAHGGRVEALGAEKARPPAGTVPGAVALRTLPLEQDAPL